jgi:hypothetical protein
MEKRYTFAWNKGSKGEKEQGKGRRKINKVRNTKKIKEKTTEHREHSDVNFHPRTVKITNNK